MSEFLNKDDKESEIRINDKDISVFSQEIVGKHRLINQLDNNFFKCSKFNRNAYENMLEFAIRFLEKIDSKKFVTITCVLRGFPFDAENENKTILYEIGYDFRYGNYICLVLNIYAFSNLYPNFKREFEPFFLKTIKDSLLRKKYLFKCVCPNKQQKRSLLTETGIRLNICSVCGCQLFA